MKESAIVTISVGIGEAKIDMEISEIELAVTSDKHLGFIVNTMIEKVKKFISENQNQDQ